MSSTNKTTNLELSQFLGSDSPKWLTDYNADMEKIDAGYQTVKAQADATDLVVSGHTSSISTLQDTTTSQGTAITGLRTDVNGNSGSINTINELLGSGEPTTTNKTIIGAINEIQGEIDDITDGYLYVGTQNLTFTADGTHTVAEDMASAYTQFLNNLHQLDDDIVLIPKQLNILHTNLFAEDPTQLSKSSDAFILTFMSFSIDDALTDAYSTTAQLAATSKCKHAKFAASVNTFSDYGAVTNTYNIVLRCYKYQKVH